MTRTLTRGAGVRLLAVAAAVAALTLVLTTSNQPAARGHTSSAKAAAGSGATTSLDPVGSRYVGDRIPIRGHTSHISGKHKLQLQRYSTARHRWVTRDTKYVRSGGYRFPAQRSSSPGLLKFRTVLYAGSRRLDRSNVITVQVIARVAPCASAPSPTSCPQPAALLEHRLVDVKDCPHLLVVTHTETRTVGWRWDSTAGTWVQDPTAWEPVPGSEQQRAAGVADCVKVVASVPSGAMLPDLRIKNLTRCGKGDSDATNGTCFMIVPSAPYDSDFPALEGRKLLKFGVITLNVGDGPGEIIADRSGAEVEDWAAYQSFYDAGGNLLGSVADPAVEFYFAGDGHNHWHVRDFDEYELVSADGTEVARAEKHGYCMQDNTSYDPMQGLPRVPTEPVYGETTTCGKGLPNALTIIHGLSRGWGDTYPSSLPDQAIDITGVPDGEYTVRVHADARGAVVESNESNNVATVRIQIAGDTVTVVPNSAAGGI